MLSTRLQIPWPGYSNLDNRYLVKAGLAGGQTANGGTGAGDDLTLSSTSHATKGSIFLGESLEIEANGSAPGATSQSILKFSTGDRIYSQTAFGRMFYAVDRFEVLSKDGVETIATFNSSASSNADRIVLNKGVCSASYAAVAPPVNGAIFAGNIGIGTNNPLQLFHAKGTANTFFLIDGNASYGSMDFRNGANNKGYIGYSLTGGYITGSINNGMHMRAANGWTFGHGSTLLFTAQNGGGIQMGAKRLQATQGADVASANDLTLGTDGNSFEITGTTQINAITIANWQNGATITLLFASTPTVKHNTAGGAGTAVILLAGAADFAATAGDTLTLLLSEIGGTQAWRELSRAVI